MGGVAKRRTYFRCQYPFVTRWGRRILIRIRRGLGRNPAMGRLRIFIFQEYIWRDDAAFMHMGGKIAATTGLTKYLVGVAPHHRPEPKNQLPHFHTVRLKLGTSISLRTPLVHTPETWFGYVLYFYTLFGAVYLSLAIAVMLVMGISRGIRSPL